MPCKGNKKYKTVQKIEIVFVHSSKVIVTRLLFLLSHENLTFQMRRESCCCLHSSHCYSEQRLITSLYLTTTQIPICQIGWPTPSFKTQTKTHKIRTSAARFSGAIRRHQRFKQNVVSTKQKLDLNACPCNLALPRKTK